MNFVITAGKERRRSKRTDISCLAELNREKLKKSKKLKQGIKTFLFPNMYYGG